MRLRIFATTLVVVSLLLTALPLRADEGMWLPDTVGKLPLAKMKAKGFALKPEEVFSNTTASLKDAVVIVDGGTGEFVSPDGLLLTNHHVAYDAIAEASTPEKDYLKNGFTAKDRSEEIPAKEYTSQILQEARDVTADVLAVIKEGMSAEERLNAIEARKKEISEAARQGKDVRCQVVEMLNGMAYYLYVYEIYRDVRLVYAPPTSIGVFGGDDDNFEWPRHTGDFTFLRVYCSPDGKPVPYSEKNVPYHPKKFLPISMNGYREGDFVMIMGYPGSTARYREAASIELNQNIQMPFFIEYFGGVIDILHEAGRDNRALELELLPSIQNFNNVMKNYQGTVRGLHRAKLLERRRAEEAEFVKFLETKPELKAKYGDVIPELNQLDGKVRKHLVNDRLLTSLVGNLIPMMGPAIVAARRALEREKPAAERSPALPEAMITAVKGAIPQIVQTRRPNIERQYLKLVLSLANKLPDDQKIPILENLFTGKTGQARKQAEEEFIRQIVEHPNFKSVEEFSKLFDMSAEQMRAHHDPVLNWFLEVAKELPGIEKRKQRLDAELAKYRRLYVEGMAVFKKSNLYPDANRTLRFTYGEVKSYKPFDGAHYDYVTTLNGVLEKDTGKEPFDVPTVLKTLAAKHDFGTYLDPKLGDVPVAFLSNTDTTGGNSGSPVMNGKGELIGVIFDVNYEGLGSDFVFNPELSRSINVDIRYVLFVTEKIGHAGYLMKELKFAGKAATAKH